MAMKQQVLTMIVAYDDDIVPAPSAWDWNYECDSSAQIAVTEYQEPTEYDSEHPRWRMGASRVGA